MPVSEAEGEGGSAFEPPQGPPDTASPRRPAVFLDRDGTLIEEAHYLADPDGVELIPGAVEALTLLRDAGYALVLVTNQSGIARGMYELEDYEAVAARLDEILARHGLVLDATRFCPHHPDYTGECSCRKPATGMHRDAAEELGLDPSASWFVGDKLRDLLPALELGGEGILVLTGFGPRYEDDLPPTFHVAEDLLQAALLILSKGG
ncbi:MAG: HAD family hydrolase [Gemmatimonadota bacterium]